MSSFLYPIRGGNDEDDFEDIPRDGDPWNKLHDSSTVPNTPHFLPDALQELLDAEREDYELDDLR